MGWNFAYLEGEASRSGSAGTFGRLSMLHGVGTQRSLGRSERGLNSCLETCQELNSFQGESIQVGMLGEIRQYGQRLLLPRSRFRLLPVQILRAANSRSEGLSMAQKQHRTGPRRRGRPVQRRSEGSPDPQRPANRHGPDHHGEVGRYLIYSWRCPSCKAWVREPVGKKCSGCRRAKA